MSELLVELRNINNNSNNKTSDHNQKAFAQQFALESFCSDWKQRIATKADGSPIALSIPSIISCKPNNNNNDHQSYILYLLNKRPLTIARIYQADDVASFSNRNNALPIGELNQPGVTEKPPKEQPESNTIDFNNNLLELNRDSSVDQAGLRLSESMRKIDISKITLIKLLNQGAFGNVYSASMIETDTKSIVADSESIYFCDGDNEPSFEYHGKSQKW